MADMMPPAPTDPNTVVPMDAPVDDGTITISITRDAEGSYTVEKETPEEDASEMGMEGSPEEMTAGATKARDLNDALKIVKSMFEEGDNASAEALFSQGFGGDAATPDLKKQPMM
jgi:hypothetical protein